MTTFEVEEIPDGDKLFYRVNDKTLRQGSEIHAGCFRQQGAGEQRGMSTDWERYSSAEQCRNRARRPLENSIVSFTKGGLERINGVDVFHAPEKDNRSHANVRWSDDHRATTRIRAILLERYQLEIASRAMG